MRKIKLFIASSLDGFIAREDGALDWLDTIPNPNQIDHGYEAFLSTVDTLIMGRSTYEEILSFGVQWPYSTCKTYVATSNQSLTVGTPKTQVMNDVNKEGIEAVKRESNKDIWLVGGGKLITHFLNLEAIDEMIISIVPTLLGKGISLFPDQPKVTSFELLSAESFETGIVNLHYRRK
jgi:dihydrofolate reductase